MYQVFNVHTGAMIAMFMFEQDAREYIALARESGLTWYDFDEIPNESAGMILRTLANGVDTNLGT